MGSFNYNSPILGQMRSGTIDDPFIPYVDITFKVINGKVQLIEIPDESHRVQVHEGATVYSEVVERTPTSLQFTVDYNLGLVSFHEAAEGKTLAFSYYGRGCLFIPADRIWTKASGGNVTETLSTIINAGENALEVIAELNGVIELAEEATNAANNAASQANSTHTAIQSAETARVSQEGQRQTNESTRSSNETNRQTAESNRTNSETNRTTAETSRSSAETTRISQETTRQTNELSRVNEESDRFANELIRISSEVIRVESEEIRDSAESSRVANETSREEAELVRMDNEEMRESSEESRVNTEITRELNEVNRGLNEAEKVVAETDRNNNEIARLNFENARVTSESSRVEAETLRESAETTRQTNTTSAIQGLNNHKNTYVFDVQPYDNAKLYKTNNQVNVNGTTYICILDSVGHSVTNTSYWRIFAAKGFDGAGTVVDIASTTDDILVSGTKDHPTVTLVSGYGANQIVKLDENAELPAEHIKQDSEHRMVSDTKMNEWNEKSVIEESTTNGNVILNEVEVVVYEHPTGDGNSHIPVTGLENGGNYLKSGATVDSAVWSPVTWNDVTSKPTTLVGYGITEFNQGVKTTDSPTFEGAHITGTLRVGTKFVLPVRTSDPVSPEIGESWFRSDL